MSASRNVVCLALLLLVAAHPGTAREALPNPAAPPAEQARARAAALADRRALQGELVQHQARVRATVAALEARSAAASDAATRALIQRHIEAAKRDAELEFFRIQLRHAQAMGRTADVSELQGVIDAQLRQPVPALAPLPPVERKVAPAVPAQTKKGSGK